jgi:glutamyl-tRNA(Gln) amidotransferase subunit E
LRAREATEGVPNDTRQAFKDGTNGFERVLPGADRMYPDTDLPPIEIPLERVERIRSQLPEHVWDREARYRRMNLPDELIQPMCMSPLAGLFDRIVNELAEAPRFVAVVLFQRLKAFRREGLKPERLSDEELFGVFKAHANGRLAREGVPKLIDLLLKAPAPRAGAESRVARLLDELRIHPIPKDELNAAVAGEIEQAEAGCFASLERKHRYLMGQLMRALSGRVEGKHVAGVLEERLSGWQNTAVAKGA